MPAAIASDGTVNLFASYREPAWHALGNVFEEEVTDYKVMLRKAGLADWDVSFENIPESFPDYRFEVGGNLVVANIGDEKRVLGITGERYGIVQNEDAFSFLQSLHDGARWETAGAIKGGRVVFGSLAFERDFVLDPSGVGDVVKSYLLVANSFDGSTNLFGGVTPVRVVCQNTLNVATGTLKNTFKMRHSSKVVDRMAAEAALWRQANTYMDEFSAEAKTLFEKSVSDKKFFDIVSDLFPKPEADVKGSVKKWEKRQEMFAQAWNGEPNAGIKGTAWGVANALTEANQWGRGIRSDKNAKERFAAAGAGFDKATNDFRQKAFDIARSL